MTLSLRYAARSHIGLVRTGNEDSGYAGPTMLVVADGMGGHAAGELASAAAVATFATIDAESDPTSETEVLTDLSAGIARTTEEIRRVVGERPQFAGMGTTLTALAWRNGLANLVHVGDSRAYLLREGELSQMTHDHTYVQMLVDTDRITPAEALTHPRRNLLLRAIDGITDVEPDLQAREAQVGDRYLLCSDGLCGVIPEALLAQLLAEGDPTYAVTALVDAALEAGAPDNVTVVVAEVVTSDHRPGDQATGAVPVVVGAASEARTRERLSYVRFPDDVEPALGPPTGEQAAVEPVELQLTSPPAPHRRDTRGRRWVPLVAIVAVLALIALVSTALSLWATAQYYVGSNAGYVAIYQGVPQSIAGRQLSSVTELSTIAVTALPDVDQSSVLRAIPVTNLDEARRVLARLEAQALSCVTAPTQGCPNAITPTAPPSPTLTPTPSPTPSTVLTSPAPESSGTQS
ncbi:MAG: serine/threonine-protein phosphatase [Actinobacteria bacterium]|uniref:Unannotated protein n=1 Tax=freshwater metagenome TaxID=449393 RepID=A0A6J7NNL5_9ZZZZ|nr:serine/threonine-protein phosphatase [Actinomycetota bacterium]